MQESCHCSACGWGWLLLLWGCVGISTLASHGAFPVALFSQLPHDRAGAQWQMNSATALARPRCQHFCLLLDVFALFFFPWKSKNLGVEVYGKGRWAFVIICIIHETSTFSMPVTSEAFRVEVASLAYLTLDSLNLQHLPGLGVLHHLSGISFSSREEKSKLNKT